MVDSRHAERGVIKMHPAKTYKEKRSILFSIFHNLSKGGPEKAFEFLDGYRKTLGEKGYIGLRAELEFYKKFIKEFSLVVAGDVGDHTDFVGQFDNVQTRIDVTTRLDMKRLNEYEAFIRDGQKYKIAIVDKNNWDLIDLVDLRFPTCNNCGGFLFKIGVLMGENFNRRGESSWSHDQKYLNVCPSCGDFEEIDTITSHFLFQISEYAQGIPAEVSQKEKNSLIQNYSKDAFNYLKKTFDPHLMALAEYRYEITKRDGDGFWGFHFNIVNSFVDNYIKDPIETGLIE